MLPRGLAPRASSFARWHARLLHLGSGSNVYVMPVPPHAVWKTPWTGSPHASGYINDVEMVAELGIAPSSPRLQRGANLSQLFSLKWVPPRGNAPRSTGYRPIALLLSDGGEKLPSAGLAREGYAPSTPGCRPGALLLHQRAGAAHGSRNCTQDHRIRTLTG